MKNYFVYILTNKTNKVLYTGVSNNLKKRVIEHRTKKFPKSFTSKYNVHKLVWYDWTESIESAISKEKQIKAGSRKAKIQLIEEKNKEWNDLFPLL